MKEIIRKCLNGLVIILDMDGSFWMISGRIEMENFENGDFVFRGVGLDHAISFAKGNPISTSKMEQMPLDWEVVEYALGDDASEMSEEDIDQAVQGICWWYDGTIQSIDGGLNTTTDFENAKGYAGDDGFVLELDVSNIEFCEFSDYHTYVRNASDVNVAGIFDCKKDRWYEPVEFLEAYDRIDEILNRIRKVIQESGYLQDSKKPDVLGLFDEIQVAGQDFLYLIKVMREESDGDRFIMGKIESLIIECVKSGNIEKFVDEIAELKTTIEQSY
jgi:hypothetical protein